ncbi:hypothetical protein UFOVP53_57 [uncultured Caudovirales phage]|uniref:Uncharacterized protein n=1 Tax=uncultured Caudovirales phage TaxID=2100421 RepID=A0A6J5KT29_9CAUD|nr:hypothetical protein UFOVP53_57 [uncultured Caudovirales phage]
MKLDSFKELLIKRAADMPDLQTLIKYMKDDFLLEHVLEALEKSVTHRKINAALKHFGSNLMENREPAMIHDALSHHASYYRAAMKAGNKPLAQAHAKQLFKIMHMGQKITKDKEAISSEDPSGDHTRGKLKVEAPDVHPWERTHYGREMNSSGTKRKMDTKGFGRSDGKIHEWLQGAPDTEVHPKSKKHEGKPYPLEEIKVNGKYLDVDPNVKLPDNATPIVSHEFDSHPIMGVYKEKGEDHAPNHDKYLNDVSAYEDSPLMDSMYDKLEAASPTRGSTPSSFDISSTPPQVAAPQVQVKSEPSNIEQPSASKEPVTANYSDRVQALMAARAKK